MPISPARTVAFDVLRGVEQGGYASDLLMARSAALDPRDAGLASQIVFGCLRYQGQLDYVIRLSSGREGRLDPEVRIALRMGVYQIRHLERIPGHAAVSESVELVKRARKRSAASMVNAVLRKVTREAVDWPDRATALSCPEWLIDSWERQFGRAPAEGIARAALREPEMYVRLPDPSAATASLEATDVAGCYRVIAGAPPGGARIQDIGSQSITPLLDLRPGQTLLDLCAAPGNKSAQALESGVAVVACDIHAARLKSAPAECRRVALDGARPLPFNTAFDRILVDAPCSGTGTLARNPEIKWRLRPQRVSELHELQVAILSNALAHLAAGGLLVYSTCSLQREENEDVVAEVLGRRPGFHAAPPVHRIPGRDAGDGFFASVITSR
jgi:16S rRNA (cytosine967-C5)-methyltransferase